MPVVFCVCARVFFLGGDSDDSMWSVYALLGGFYFGRKEGVYVMLFNNQSIHIFQTLSRV